MHSIFSMGKCQDKMHTRGIEPRSQAWKACMMPLHYVCCCNRTAQNLLVHVDVFGQTFMQAVIAQLVARRSHNPKVVSSILTCRKLYAIAAAPIGVLVGAKVSLTCLRASNCGFAAGV